MDDIIRRDGLKAEVYDRGKFDKHRRGFGQGHIHRCGGYHRDVGGPYQGCLCSDSRASRYQRTFWASHRPSVGRPVVGDLAGFAITDSIGKMDRCSMSGRTALLHFTAALRFIALVKEGDQHEGLVRIGRINRAVNFALRAVNSTVQTTWTSPLSALATGFGDCKQYAVLKYAVLDEAGFAPDDLRLVIVRIKSRQDNHAVVAVRNAAHWFILDNRSLAVVESGKLLDYYLPLVTLDHRGVRPFVLPSGPRVAGLLQWEHR
jgi:predicted transglutaminase-like cysteine proteinase